MPLKRNDPWRDPALLLDMHTAACAIVSFVSGKSFDDYESDLMLRSAVERQIEIVGEAARGVSAAFQAAHPAIPWRPIMAQRHRLAHEYGVIDDRLIWTVATVHVPALILLLEPLLPPTIPDS